MQIFDLGANLLILRKKKRISQDELGEMVGVSGAQIGRYEKGKDNISNEMVRKLSNALEVTEIELRGLNKMEILTSERKGQPERLGSRTDTGKPGGYVERKIPLYDAIAVGGNYLLADQTPLSEPIEYIDPGDLLRAATGAMRIYGHSMFPKYPSGCTVTFRKADKELIFWGEDYVLEMEDRRILKRLEKSENKENVKAVSYNKSEQYVYADVEIPIGKIKRLFMVLGKVELEASI